MIQPRTTLSRSILLLGIALMIGPWAATPARAQYPYGPGFAYPGYGFGGYGYGYGGYGYGFPGYGYGIGYGYGGFPGIGYLGGAGPGVVTPGYNPLMGGFYSPSAFGGVVGVPGYGPSGIGFANPLFGLGLSPLAVQTAAAERALVRGSTSADRSRIPVTSAPAPSTGTTTRGFPPLPNR